ncbi:hypothetical protein CIHG_09904 [Coccidioides immitis H538.4]|uniref:DUF6590 domain-containing protein n=2 Tax=Coccidioides immitis TaxID=5501 RepID=A0A0J8S5E5_COCIT|nr:hypothetical protein CIRG_05144 [Coccidioides immitis RMSCC 2394]KMU92066.1 hypothetical protein CIHG_09904 [Coccidioides immitis H538.4]
MPRNQSAQNAKRWRDQDGLAPGLPLHTRPRYSNPAYDGPNAAAIAPVGQPRLNRFPDQPTSNFPSQHNGGAIYANRPPARNKNSRQGHPHEDQDLLDPVFWHETASSTSDTASSQSTIPSKYGERAHCSARRMIVVKQGKGFCLCVAITTYRHRGLQKPGIEIGAHAVIHMKDTDPEKMNIKYYDLAKQPLAVEPASMTEKLLPSSVVHVGKIHTVEFNQKVKEVGVLTGESRKRLREYINGSLNLDALEHDKK